MEELKSRWVEILLAVKTEFDIQNTSYDTFLKILEPYSIEDNTLYILYPVDTDQIALNFIKRQYEVPLQFKIKEIIGVDYTLQFILPKNTNSIVQSEEQVLTSHPGYEDTNLNPLYNFEKFVEGDKNRFAKASALAVAEAPGESYNPFYLYGGPGLGKTHLLHSIGNHIVNKYPNMKVMYMTCEEFTNEFISSLSNPETRDKMREKFRLVDVLMIDDIQFLIGKVETQNEFFNTFNALYLNGKQIVLSSDRPPKELSDLNERLTSRFNQGLLADIGTPDYETRMAILQKKSENFEFKFTDDIFNYIATNIKTNIRDLEGALNKLEAYSKLQHLDITLEIAQKELSSIISPDKPKEITAQLIIEVVADHYNISIDQMISKSRSAQFNRPRQIAMYLCDQMTDSTKTYVGTLLGDRDHATVINGINKITDEYNRNEEFKAEIDIIKNKIDPIV